MVFIMINEAFTCMHCAKEVPIHPTGSARNHCPFCLHSLHVDQHFPGDRAAHCGGLMHPVGIEYRKNKGDMLIHRCQQCGKESINKIAPDDDFLGFIRQMNSR